VKYSKISVLYNCETNNHGSIGGLAKQQDLSEKMLFSRFCKLWKHQNKPSHFQVIFQSKTTKRIQRLFKLQVI